MSTHYPSPEDVLKLTWAELEPFALDLYTENLDTCNIDEWVAEWSKFNEMIGEIASSLQIAVSVNTADAEAEVAYTRFLEEIEENYVLHNQKLKEKLLSSGLTPKNFDQTLKNMRVEADLFREENVPLSTEESKLGLEYDKIVGSQTVEWDGETKTLTQLSLVGFEEDRARREAAWKAGMSRRLQDREAINQLWAKFVDVRVRQATNAGFDGDYRAYKWGYLHRFDYTPENCKQFGDAIAEVVVPAAQRIYDRRKAALGVDTLRPWDLDVDASGQPALKPFKDAAELTNKCREIFEAVDPVLAGYLDEMSALGLLDLENRPNKAPGAYCAEYPMRHRPFIFMNAVGTHGDVQTMLHESGHAFHCFEANALPLMFNREYGSEIAEVASMSMELLGAPHFEGVFYSREEANRAQAEHLEKLLLFWPYMAVVDGFQHWVYENPELAKVSSECDSAWDKLWERFMPGVDWTGLEEERKTGWHRKLHIHQVPFYYVEYGLAQLGAVQVWANSLQDAKKAVADYRYALSLGGTKSLPELFAAAGAKFAFDSETLGKAVSLIETQLDRLH